MALTVIGVFDDASEAKQAVQLLVNAGFLRGNIDLSAQTDATTSTSADLTGTTATGTARPDAYDNSTRDSGGIGGFFSSLFGGDNDDQQKYTRVANQGSVVTVHAQTDDEAERAADILDDAGAVDVNERAAQYGHGLTTDSMTTGAMATGTMTTDSLNTGTTGTVGDVMSGQTTGNDQTIKVIEENLEVGKRTVETGGVRLRSRIVARPVEESVRLREERVSVQRTPVNRPATTADLNAFQESEISMTEQAEVAVVSKTAQVVEEITIGKEVTEREEIIRDTVRRTDVDVEQLGSTNPNKPASSGN